MKSEITDLVEIVGREVGGARAIAMLLSESHEVDEVGLTRHRTRT